MPFQRPAAVLVHGHITGYWANQPHRGEAVSGDDLFEEVGRTDARQLLLLIDVMGHGPAAAQIVHLLGSHLLQDAQCQNLTPADLLTTLHGMLEPAFATSGEFVAALALLADGRTGTILGGAAALPEPWLEGVGGWQPWSCAVGPPLGLPFPEITYQHNALTLAPGQRLLAFTDGVIEAGAGLGSQYQHGRLQAFLARLTPDQAPDRIVALLLADLQDHAGPLWPQDDTSILCLRYT